MLVIRFSRIGRKNKPQFRLVVQEHTSAPTGRHVEIVGSWNPILKKGVFKNERIEYWLSQGARSSDPVNNLLVSQGIIKGEKRKIKISKKKTEGDETKTEGEQKAGGEAPAEAPKAEETPKEEKVEAPKEEVKAEEAPKEEKAEVSKAEEAPKEERKTEEAPKPVSADAKVSDEAREEEKK